VGFGLDRLAGKVVLRVFVDAHGDAHVVDGFLQQGGLGRQIGYLLLDLVGVVDEIAGQLLHGLTVTELRQVLEWPFEGNQVFLLEEGEDVLQALLKRVVLCLQLLDDLIVVFVFGLWFDGGSEADTVQVGWRLVLQRVLSDYLFELKGFGESGGGRVGGSGKEKFLIAFGLWKEWLGSFNTHEALRFVHISQVLLVVIA
jgi:hypothetical protein